MPTPLPSSQAKRFAIGCINQCLVQPGTYFIISCHFNATEMSSLIYQAGRAELNVHSLFNGYFLVIFLFNLKGALGIYFSEALVVRCFCFVAFRLLCYFAVVFLFICSVSFVTVTVLVCIIVFLHCLLFLLASLFCLLCFCCVCFACWTTTSK